MKGKVVAFKPEDGSQLWSCAGIRGYVCPSIIVQDGIIYSIGGKNRPVLATSFIRDRYAALR